MFYTITSGYNGCKAKGQSKKTKGGKMPETNKCVLCGEEYEGYGNNAEPVAEGRCCDKCDAEVVIPARIGGATGGGRFRDETEEDYEFKDPDYVIDGEARFIMAGKTITIDHKVNEEWLVNNLRRCFKDFDVAYGSAPMMGLRALIHGDRGADEKFPAEEDSTFAATFCIGKDKFDAYMESAVVLKRMGLKDEAQRLADYAHMFLSVFTLLLMNSKYAHRSAIKTFLNASNDEITTHDKEYVADVMGVKYDSAASFMDFLHMLLGGDAHVFAIVKD